MQLEQDLQAVQTPVGLQVPAKAVVQNSAINNVRTRGNSFGSYVVDGVLIGCKSVISNEEQILKKFARF